MQKFHLHFSTSRHLGDVLDQRYIKAGLHPVGRLDYDTSGLILFSSNGDLTQRLLHPRHKVEKEYVATVENRVEANTLKKKLEDGVETTEGIHTAKLLEVSQPFEIEMDDSTPCNAADDGQVDRNDDVEENAKIYHTNIRLIVSEGKHRMVRRMLANVGHPVVQLKRERHGMIELGDIGIGEFRHLNEEEVLWAEKLISGEK